MGAITPSYFQTCKVMATDLLYIPLTMSESTDVVDKVCKFVIGLQFCPTDIAKEFKTTAGLISTLGFSNTVAGFSNTISGARGAYLTTAKKISKGILLGAQGLDLFKGLDQLKILSLATVSQFMGRYSFTAVILDYSPAFSVVKDGLILASTGFSIYDNYNESVKIEKEAGPTNVQTYQQKVHKNRIAVIADVAKFAIVGLTLSITAASTLTTMPVSGTVLALSYTVLKVGQYANSLGMISASVALIKATHGAAAA